MEDFQPLFHGPEDGALDRADGQMKEDILRMRQKYRLALLTLTCYAAEVHGWRQSANPTNDKPQPSIEEIMLDIAQTLKMNMG